MTMTTEREAERAAIVKWLREQADLAEEQAINARDLGLDIAEAIRALSQESEYD